MELIDFDDASSTEKTFSAAWRTALGCQGEGSALPISFRHGGFAIMSEKPKPTKRRKRRVKEPLTEERKKALYYGINALLLQGGR